MTADPRQDTYREWHRTGKWVEVDLTESRSQRDARCVLRVIDTDAPRCQRPDCDNPLDGRQTQYCSPRCGATMRKRRQRDLAKLSLVDAQLVAATLEAPDEFLTQVHKAKQYARNVIRLTDDVDVDAEILTCFRETTRRR